MQVKKKSKFVIGSIIAASVGFGSWSMYASGPAEIVPEEEQESVQENEDVAVEGYDEELPNVEILATGGTIAAVGEERTDLADYTAGEIEIQDLIEQVPELEGIANVTGEDITGVNSNDINNEILLELAHEVNERLASDDVDGIVITHGTNTLEETAYFLNLVVDSEKPVVMVGAMRPDTAMSSDGELNLYNAVLLAGHEEAKDRGVMISQNDRIGSARDVSKTNTMQIDTFTSTEMGYLGNIIDGEPRFYTETTRTHTADSEFDVSDVEELPEVDIIYTHQSDRSYMFEAAANQGVDGLIVAGAGNGGMSSNAREGAEYAHDNGVMVVRSSRVGNGIVTPDEDSDFLTSDTLNPVKARILLTVALTQTDDPEEIQSYFEEY
ncbi:type II asparaginase [Thalassorhabdus alkalitolerans]|uniref:asparaginase n=1 Tax=Thalassorhabdus alkalitolerans TaxID=2282697 RepID=A0ABW0YG87_9BACI